MRILHINCNYIGTTLHQLMIEALEKCGIENEVFVPTYDKNVSVISTNENVYVSECFNKWDRVAFDYKQKKILKAIESHYDIKSFDLIHAYTLFTDGNVTRRLSEKYGIPFVVAVRNTDINDFLKKMIYLRKRGISTMYAAQKVFFLSKAYQNTVLDKYLRKKDCVNFINKFEIIPNGIDNFWFENRYFKKTIELKRFEQRHIKLMYAGGIDKNKNIVTTCKAIKLLKSEGWQVDFSVVGKIKDQKIYEEIRDEVKYYFPRPKEELIELYREADIFIMPSYSETFGLVYAEAMTQALPVVYTRGQGFDGQFEEGIVGFHVDPYSVNDIVRAIVQIINNYERISMNCIEKSIHFKWDEIIKKYCDIYKNINKSNDT